GGLRLRASWPPASSAICGARAPPPPRRSIPSRAYRPPRRHNARIDSLPAGTRSRRLSCAFSFRGACEDEAQSFDDERFERCSSSYGLKLHPDHKRDGEGDCRHHLLPGLGGPRSASSHAPGCGHEGSFHISVWYPSTHLTARTEAI